jgi:hypothetical protein
MIKGENMAKSYNFGGKKAAPFVSAKKSKGKAATKRKKSSTKTAKGLKKK